MLDYVSHIMLNDGILCYAIFYDRFWCYTVFSTFQYVSLCHFMSYVIPETVSCQCGFLTFSVRLLLWGGEDLVRASSYLSRISVLCSCRCAAQTFCSHPSIDGGYGVLPLQEIQIRCNIQCIDSLLVE